MMALLIEKMNSPLIKVKKNAPHRFFKICVIAGNGSREVVTAEFFISFSA